MPLSSPPGPADRHRQQRRRRARRSRRRLRCAVAVAGAAMLAGAAYGVWTVAPMLFPAAGEDAAGPAAAAEDPVPTAEGVGDQVGTPARLTAPPERITQPSAPPDVRALGTTRAPGASGPPDAQPAPLPPAAPDPPEPRPQSRPAPPADLPGPPPPARPPGGFTEEEVRRGLELWQRYRDWTGLGG